MEISKRRTSKAQIAARYTDFGMASGTIRRGRRMVATGAFALWTAFFALAVAGANGQAARAKASTTAYPQEINRVTFAIAGDVIPHEAVVQSAMAAAAASR